MQRDTIITARSFGPRVLHIKAGILRGILRGGGAVFREALQIILDLDAHHQMRSAFQIQPKRNVLRERRLDPRPGEVFEVRPPAMRANHDVNADNRDDADDYRSLQ